MFMLSLFKNSNLLFWYRGWVHSSALIAIQVNTSYQSKWYIFMPFKKKLVRIQPVVCCSFVASSVGPSVLDGLFQCLTQMITSMRGCLACNAFWPRHISSRSFSHTTAGRWHSFYIWCQKYWHGFWPWPISMVSCQKGPTCHTYAWQIGPFWQDTLDIFKDI